MARKRKNRLIAVLAVLVLAGGAAGFWTWNALMGNAVEREASVYIPAGADYAALTDSLTAAGVIKDMDRFGQTARLLGFDGEVRPGHYRLKKGTSYKDAVRAFQRGWQTPVRLTFNNIRTLPQLAGRVAQQLEVDSLTMTAALTADTTAARYGFDGRTFIAMFIPDTYEVYWTATPVAFLDRMHREWERFWNDGRMEKLAATGLSQVEAVTLASIVWEETKMTDEMPTVAGVYINRLAQGMPLQADPTVKFAVGDFTLRRVLNRHLEADSPYNTYKYAGLPPGPISMPSVRAIDAVLDYQKHKYLYFAARPDFSGYHNFAATLTQHNRNADEYRRALNAAGIR